MPPLLPVYCSPSEAFALSAISSPIDFRDELHRMFMEGLAATGIRDIRDGTREDIPLKDWLDHVPTLAGEVLTRKSLPLFVTYGGGGMPSYCHLDFSDNTKGMASYRAEQPGCHGDSCSKAKRVSFRVKQPRLVWYDLLFLTKDFLKRQKGPRAPASHFAALQPGRRILPRASS